MGTYGLPPVLDDVDDVLRADVQALVNLHGAVAVRSELDRLAPGFGLPDWSHDEKTAVLAFVNVATPVIVELREHLPALRALAAVGQQMAKGGPGAILGLLRGGA